MFLGLIGAVIMLFLNSFLIIFIFFFIILNIFFLILHILNESVFLFFDNDIFSVSSILYNLYLILYYLWYWIIFNNGIFYFNSLSLIKY